MGRKEWLCDLGGGKQSCDLQRSGVKVDEDVVFRWCRNDVAEGRGLKERDDLQEGDMKETK